MSFTLTTHEANIEAKITALTGSEDIKDFLILKKASNGLAISNIATLDTYIQTWVDNQTSATAANKLLMATAAMSPTTLLQRTIQSNTYPASTTLTVPANCYKMLVTGGAAGGNGGNGVSNANFARGGGGGGAGAYVEDYEILVNPNDSLSLTIGDTISVENLVIQAGQDGENAILSAGSENQAQGGSGGIVTYLGVPVTESATVIYGADGSAGNAELAAGDTASSSAFGGDGGASAAGAGGAGGDGSSDTTDDGQNSSVNMSGGGGAADSSGIAGTGGDNTSVIIRYIIETVV